MAPSRAVQQSLFPVDSDEGKIPTPKPEDVRRRLNGIIRKLRESDELPWSLHEFRTWRIIFPQMTNWLPDEEAEELKEAFFVEHDRWRARLGPEADPLPRWKSSQP